MDLSFEPGQVQTSVLFKLVKNDKISENILNSGLKKISKRADQWKMPFNPDDTKQAAQVFFQGNRMRTVLYNLSLITIQFQW